MFILSSLPLIDLLNISVCSKMFYRLARDDEAFKISSRILILLLRVLICLTDTMTSACRSIVNYLTGCKNILMRT